MAGVFISYSREDSAFAKRLSNDLKELDLNILSDEELILPGEEWAFHLESAFKKARFILLLLSPSYFNSQWAQKEMELAFISDHAGSSYIIPILVQKTELPNLIRNKYYADFCHDYDDGMKTLKRALTSKPAAQKSARKKESRKMLDILVIVMLGFISSILGSITTDNLRIESVVLIVIFFAGLTALIAGAVAFFQPSRGSGSVEIVSRNIDQIYQDALENSHLNPLRTKGMTHD